MSTTHSYLRWIAALALALTAAMANSADQSAGQMQSQSTTGTASRVTDSQSAQANSGKPVSAADRRMMSELARANIAEIEVSKLAEQRSKNAEVLAFAKKMIEDHTQASNDLQQLAEQKGVKLPTTPDAKHQAMAKQMSRLSAEQFDRQYMARAGMHDHQSTQALLERIRKNAVDPDLRALAEKVLPVVEEHLQAAKEQMQSRSAGE